MAALPTRTVYASVRMALEYPIDAVWAVAGRFDGLEAWADGVSACSVEGDGVGCVRTVTRGGVVREQLESRDPGRHQISYTILAPHALPADDVRGEITLTALGPEATQIVWRSEAARFHAPPEALGERIEAFYRASIGGLERVLSTNRSAKPEANSGPVFTGAG
jgi:hypothetical protein